MGKIADKIDFWGRVDWVIDKLNRVVDHPFLSGGAMSVLATIGSFVMSLPLWQAILFVLGVLTLTVFLLAKYEEYRAYRRERRSLSITLRPEITYGGILLIVNNDDTSDTFSATMLQFPTSVPKPRWGYLRPRGEDGDSRRIDKGMSGGFWLCDFGVKAPSAPDDTESIDSHPAFVLSVAETTGRRMAAGFVLPYSDHASFDYGGTFGIPVRVGAEDLGLTAEFSVTITVRWATDGRSVIEAAIIPEELDENPNHPWVRGYADNHWDSHDDWKEWHPDQISVPVTLFDKAVR